LHERLPRAALVAAGLCLWAGATAWVARAQAQTQAQAQPQGQTQSQPQGPASDRPAPMDKPYTVLLERSMFSKDGRSRSAPRPPTTTTTAPVVKPLTPEQANVFRGVLCPDDEYVAFIQNVQTEQVNVLKAGDEIAGGRIAAITLDTLNFATAGKVHEIRVGQNLAGETVAVSTSSTSGSSGSGSTTGFVGSGSSGTTSSSTQSRPSDPAQAAILERLRARRSSGQ
jgi:hypothetical protein